MKVCFRSHWERVENNRPGVMKSGSMEFGAVTIPSLSLFFAFRFIEYTHRKLRQRKQIKFAHYHIASKQR